MNQIVHQPSIADLASFLVAEKIGGILLTGDYDLRNLAKKHLEVHGFLWIMDQLVDNEVVSKKEAHECLTMLMQDPNTRLPKNECEKRLRNWQIE